MIDDEKTSQHVDTSCGQWFSGIRLMTNEELHRILDQLSEKPASGPAVVGDLPGDSPGDSPGMSPKRVASTPEDGLAP